jgi:uncharacterized protein
MDVTPLIRKGAQVIQSYASGTFTVTGKIYTGPVIIFPDEVLEWKISTPLSAEDFALLVERKDVLDVVLLGMGKNMALLDPQLRKTLKERGVSPEPMDTGAACRTYNLLMAEGRRVAAALIPVTS